MRPTLLRVTPRLHATGCRPTHDETRQLHVREQLLGTARGHASFVDRPVNFCQHVNRTPTVSKRQGPICDLEQSRQSWRLGRVRSLPCLSDVSVFEQTARHPQTAGKLSSPTRLCWPERPDISPRAMMMGRPTVRSSSSIRPLRLGGWPTWTVRSSNITLQTFRYETRCRRVRPSTPSQSSASLKQ